MDVSNNVTLIGRLTKDVELRYTNNNVAVGSFTIAIDKYISKERTDTYFIPIVVWDKKAEWASNHLFKGKKVALCGYISTRNWDDNEGKKHYATEVVAESLAFADDKKKDEQQPQNQQSQPQTQRQPAQTSTQQQTDNNWWQQPPAQGQQQIDTSGKPPWVR